MVNDLLQLTAAIEHICDELLSQQYGSLAERQIEKVRIIQTQAQNLTQLCEDYSSQLACTEDLERHILWNLSSEFRTPTALIDTSVYLLGRYDNKQVAPLNTQQQKCVQDIQDQLHTLSSLWDRFLVELQRQIDDDDSG